MTKKPKKRGGARPGAGRKIAFPKEGRTISICIAVPEALADKLDRKVKSSEKSRSAVVSIALRRFFRSSRH